MAETDTADVLPEGESVLAENDSTQEYLRHREDLAQSTAADELLLRVRTRSATPPKSIAATADEARSGDPKGGLKLAGAAARDIARGTTEIPRAVSGGFIDAVNSTLALGNDIDNWVNERLPLAGIQIRYDEAGKFTGVGVATPEQMKTQEFSGLEIPGIYQDDPQSVTGGMVKGIVQFSVGMLGAGKINALKKLSETSQVGGAAIKGMIADLTVFEGDEGRVSDLIQEFPALANPVTQYLATQPDDTAAEGRLKNALEGLGLGIALDGFISALKMLREQRIIKRQAGQEAASEPVRRELSPDAWRLIGDPSDTRSIIDTTQEMLEGVEKAKTGPSQFVNWARIDTDESVQELMDEFVKRTSGNLEDARRGVQSFKKIKLNADQQNAWQILVERRKGEPLNAEQSVAARQLWVSSSEKLKEVAGVAAENPSEANLFAFRKMMAVQFAVQNQVISARTETARALASWRIPAGSSKEQMVSIQQLLEQSGGDATAREMAIRVAALGDVGFNRELNDFVEKSVYAKTRDAVIEAWVMGLLSGPKTHLVNIMSNTSVIGMQMYERGVAAQISRLLGDESGVAMGEATAQWFGLVEGAKDGLRYAAKTAKTGQSGFGMGKIDIPQQGAISSEAFNISNSSWMGQAVDGLGTIVRIPGRALQAEDEFFKTIGYRMELNARALRQARNEVNAGKIQPEQLKERITELREDPPDDLRLDAMDAALYQTFTNSTGPFANSIMKVANRYPLLRTLVPFIRTPANILHYTFERTPLAPFMATVRADVAAGGARRDLAMARMATGSMIMLTFTDLALSGTVSGGGPVEPSQREALLRSGWQPYSYRVDGRWYAYNRLDPVGTLMGLSADMVELMNNTDWGDEEAQDFENVAAAMVAATAGNVMNKTYLSGISDAIEAISDPRRRSEAFFQRMAGSVVPTGIAEIRRAQDPYMREVQSMVDAIRNRTPGLSEGLPIRRDLWGRSIGYQSGLGWAYDAVSPVYSRQENPEPIDSELLTGGEFSRARAEGREVLDTGGSLSIAMPGVQVNFNGVTANLKNYPGAYSRYLQLAGNELVHPAWGTGAKDLLNAIVTGHHPLSQVYDIKSDGPDGGKETFLRDIVNQYRKMARTQLLDEYPQLRRDVAGKQEKKRELKMPRIG